VEKEDSILVIKRIHVVYQLTADTRKREIIQRVYEMHALRCPVYKTLHGCIDITTELRLSAD